MRYTSFAAKRWAKTAAVLAISVLACSHARTRLLANNTVFSFGANNYGQTGQGSDTGVTPVAAPIDTANLAGKTIIDVEAGARHSLLLADDGSVFSFGSNDAGQTGLGTNMGMTLAPTPIDTTNLAGKKITQMAAGFLHNLLLAEDGSVFSFGWKAHGVNGLGFYPDTEVMVATPIDATPLGGRRIKQVAAGNAHSLLLAEDGTVFSFGNNEHGQLGLGTDGDTTPIATPIDTRNLAGRTITEVAAGGNYSLLLSNDGTVFSMGLNSQGQTGLGTGNGWTTVATPIVTTNLAGKKIAHVAADGAGNRGLLLAEDGTVFSFGNRSTAGAGTGPDLLIATPIDTTNLTDKTITRLAAGGALSLLAADDGSVFSFGANFANGTGLDIGDYTFVATPINTTNLAGMRITAISAGDTHGLLLAVPDSVPGDYNHDGAVDAADYVVWRKNDGSPEGYNTWRANFGATAAGAAAVPRSGATGPASTAVPEPTTLWLGLACVALWRRVRVKRLL